MIDQNAPATEELETRPSSGPQASVTSGGALERWFGERFEPQWAALAVLIFLVFLAYFDVFWRLSRGFWQSASYSHAWLIPVLAAAIIYIRRERFVQPKAWEMWAGVGLTAIGLLIRIEAATRQIAVVEHWSIVPVLMGCFTIVGGWRAFLWSAPGLIFLVLMYPLPRFLEEDFLHWLQHKNSIASTMTLQTLGVPCFREGNIIRLDGDESLNVAEACSGLRTATVCFAISAGMALIMTWRPWWERAILVASAIPIALLVNTIRITTTGLMYYWFEADLPQATNIFHDGAGLMMIFLALGFLMLEMKVLSWIVIRDDSQSPSMPAAAPLGMESASPRSDSR